MDTRKLFMIASAGIIFGMFSVFLYNENIKKRDPLSVSFNPYKNGIYATGIVESFQKTGSNINIFPAVSDAVVNVLVKDGQVVKQGDILLEIDSSTQAALVKKDASEIEYAKANLLNYQEQYEKISKSYALNKQSISKNALDNAKNAVLIAEQQVNVAQDQLKYDEAELDDYTIRAPVDGVVLRVVPGVGDFVSENLGVFDPYTQAYLPIVQMSQSMTHLQVRVYVDEILIPLLPTGDKLEAQLFVRGMKNKAVPLKFVNMQPYTIPQIQLSDQRNERVDVRVLPIIFEFEKPKDLNIFPGQLVDVYLKGTS